MFHHSKRNRVLIENHYLYVAIKADLRGFVINRAAKGSTARGLRATTRRFLIALPAVIAPAPHAAQSSSSFLRVVCKGILFEIECWSYRSSMQMRKFISSTLWLILIVISVSQCNFIQLFTQSVGRISKLSINFAIWTSEFTTYKSKCIGHTNN